MLQRWDNAGGMGMFLFVFGGGRGDFHIWGHFKFLRSLFFLGISTILKLSSKLFKFHHTDPQHYFICSKYRNFPIRRICSFGSNLYDPDYCQAQLQRQL